jgi:hypothetical protein
MFVMPRESYTRVMPRRSRQDAERSAKAERPEWQTGNRRSRTGAEPAGFWGWIGQSLSQLQEALRGGSGQWQGPGA